MTPDPLRWVPGVVVAGYGVASGSAAASPYPAGSIALQLPFFRERGVDLSPYFAGTLNVDVAPHVPVPRQPLFDDSIRWFGDVQERFLLMPTSLDANGRTFVGLWYYPHPATKPAHVQRPTVVELLLPWIAGVAPGAAVQVGFQGD